MRRITITFVFFIALLSTGVIRSISSAAKEQASGTVEISMHYERQEGRGSNQYAVWIENTDGKLVKTLFVTNFTAQKGWERRPACTPIWVNKADAGSLSQEEIDGFSGATPSSGVQRYVWDMTDSTGNRVASGTYRFVVEATLINESHVVYKGEINTSGTEIRVNTEPEYDTDVASHRGMITKVEAHVIP